MPEDDMITAWYITDWDQRYECNDQNRPVRDRAKARAKRLPWIRMKVSGRAMSDGYRRLQAAVGSSRNLEGVFATWCKLLELAADQPRELRGWVLDGNGQPATVEDLCFWTGFSARTIEYALKALSDLRIRWICKSTLPPKPTGTYRNLQEPTTPGYPDGDGDGDRYGDRDREKEEEGTTPQTPTPKRKPKREPQQPPISWNPQAGWTGITEAHRDRWAKAAPACDIGRQLASMDAWLRANPEKAVKRRWERFVVNWLSRSQDHGGDQQKTASTHRSAHRPGDGRVAPATAGGFREPIRIDPT